MSNDLMVEVRGIVNRFGAQIVHDRLDMEVRKDEVFGIVGGSGSGKSVLLRTILGLQRPKAGVVKLEGRDITGLSESELRSVKSHYGVTFQQGALFSSLTVLQNVQLPMIEHLQLPNAELDERAMRHIKLVGLPPDAARKYPSQLSGGMQQRLQIARCLAQDPSVLLLDEPFGALDAMTRQSLQDEVLRIVAERHATVLFVTHDLEEALYLGDRVIALNANPGRIARTLDVPLPRPRNQLATREHPEFLRLRRELFSVVEEIHA